MSRSDSNPFKLSPASLTNSPPRTPVPDHEGALPALLGSALSPRLSSLDRTLLFSRERLNAESRQTTRSRAMTPMEIKQWQRSIPLTGVREELRLRRMHLPAREVQRAEINDAKRELQEYLTTETNIKYHMHGSATAALADALNTAAAKFDLKPTLDDPTTPKKQVLTRGALEKNTPETQTSPLRRSGLVRRRPQPLLRSVLSSSTLLSEANSVEEVPVANLTPEEAVEIATQWCRIDELGIGVVNIADVRRWCVDIFKRPIDEPLARRLLDHEAGVVDLRRFCQLTRPDIDPALSFASVEAVFVTSPSHPSVTSPKKTPNKKEAPAVTTAQRMLRDPRQWMSLVDSGLVKMLREMYLRYRVSLLGVPRKEYLRRFKRLLPVADLQKTFNECDVDGDDHLCFEEFARCMWPGLSPGNPFPVPKTTQ